RSVYYLVPSRSGSRAPREFTSRAYANSELAYSKSSWQGEHDAGAATTHAMKINATRVSLDNAACKRQAESHAIRLRREQGSKRTSRNVRRHSGTCILDCDLD